jgi:LAS superfamily LD-carboxypeptidase LdcB
MRRIAELFVQLLQASGYRVTVTSVRRDLDEQARLYARAQAGRSKYPAAAPGHSMHELGIAFDLQLQPADYTPAGEAWESLGFRWGGRFDDPIHFDFLPRSLMEP